MAFVATAVVAAVELGTVAAIATAVTEVGIAMTVIGAVTHNKDLVKIGGVLSLAGGIGGLAAGAIDGAAAGTMEAAASSDVGNGIVNGAAGSVTDAAVGADAAAASSDAGNGLLGSEVANPALDSAANLPAGPGSITNTMPADPSVQAAAPNTALGTQQPPSAPDSTALTTDVTNQSGNLGPTGVTAPASPADFQVGGRYGPDGMDFGGWNPATASTTSQPSGNIFSRFSDFAEKNKTLVQGGMQFIGGAMSGMNQRQIADQKAAIDRQRLNQIGYGNTVGQFAPSTGIINGARA